MIVPSRGNLLLADVEAVVNTVNCVGVMGKGIALQFKQAFPDNFRVYEKACKAGEVQIGRMFTFATGQMGNPKFIINFPTKRHWKGMSRIQDIEAGLVALVEEVRRLGVRSIAVPPVGCGNGGLDWKQIEPRIIKAFEAVPDVRVLLYPPIGAPVAESMPVGTEAPRMTRGRAMVLRLLELYQSQGYRHTLLEVQKLAYFLQVAGEELRLKFLPAKYGPYAENLNHVLERLEGHFIRGFGDRSTAVEIHLLPEASDAVREFFGTSADAEATQRLQRVADLIEGFETPYGMELLATVHWVGSHDERAAKDPNVAMAGVRAWNAGKAKRFCVDHHIIAAWQILRDQEWFSSRAD